MESLSKEYQRRRGINMYTRYLHGKRSDDLCYRYRDDRRGSLPISDVTKLNSANERTLAGHRYFAAV